MVACKVSKKKRFRQKRLCWNRNQR